MFSYSSFWTVSNSDSFNFTSHFRTFNLILFYWDFIYHSLNHGRGCTDLIQLSGYTCQNNELSFVSKHFEAEWIMLAKEMVPALAPISVVIVRLESIRAINIPKVKTVYHHNQNNNKNSNKCNNNNNNNNNNSNNTF